MTCKPAIKVIGQKVQTKLENFTTCKCKIYRKRKGKMENVDIVLLIRNILAWELI